VYTFIKILDTRGGVMKIRFIVAAIILSVVALIFCQAAVAADPVKEAKNAYAQFVKTAKANEVEAAKKLIAKDALSDLEKDKAVDLFIAMQADITPETIKAAKAEVKGSMVVLKIEQVEKSKEGTVSSKATVYMVNEGGQWKVGKPAGAK
jgi:predicted lipid-binding transport protein (Tim44 family)